MDITTLNQLLSTDGVAVSVIVLALTEYVKSTNYITERYIPLVPVLVGILSGLYFFGLSLDGAVVGLLTGLGTMGIFKIGKTTIVGA